MLWEEHSWPQLQQLDKDLPVVIPLAACEQHGPHLPVFVDTIQVTEIAQQVEAKLSDRILLLPTMWLGCSHHHKDFPGTISVLPSLYIQMIQEIARSVLRAGFGRIFFLNGHGGNRAPAADALSELIATDNKADGACLALASWWEVAAEGIKPEKVGLTQPVVAHACAYETSLMLAVRPELVHKDKLTPRPSPVMQGPWFYSEDDSSSRVATFHRFHRYNADGVLGNPDEASMESGQAILDAVVDQVVSFLNDFGQWPELPACGPDST